MFCALLYIVIPIHAIHSTGLPLTIEESCSSSLCTIEWTPSYDRIINYTVTIIDLINNSIYIVTVPVDMNSYSITELSVNVMYNVSVTALFVCGGSTTSNNVIIEGECICSQPLYMSTYSC